MAAASPPSSTGALARTPLAHLFVFACQRRLSGSLQLDAHDGAEATLVLAQGRVAKVRTTGSVAYLGAVLYEMGALDDAELNASLLEVARQRRPHGRILLERGSITREQLADALREQTLRKLAYLFTLPSETTTFLFEQDVDRLPGWGGDEPLRIDPYPAIWRGVREHPPERHVHEVLARVGGWPCKMVEGAEVARFHFGAEELAAIDCLRARSMGIAELAATRLLPPRTTELLVYALVITKQATIDERAPSSIAPSRPPPSIGAPSLPPASIAPTAIAPASVASMPAASPGASVPPVAARASTPPAAARASVPPGEPPRASPASAPPEPPISFNLRIASPVPRRSSAAAVAAVRGSPSSLPPSARVQSELAAREQQIHARAAAIQKEDLFQRLSLPRDATAEQVETAFATLARLWSPNDLPPALERARDDCAKVLAALEEAHATLGDTRRRAEYVRQLRTGHALLPQDRHADDLAASGADNDFDGAKNLLARDDLARAERLARRAHRAEPQKAAPLALLAWIEALEPANHGVDATKVRIQMLDRALRLDDACEDALYWRALLHKRIDAHAAAIRDLRKLVAIAPGHVDAARELRIYEMRVRRSSIAIEAAGGKPSPASGTKKPSGLFERLIKK